MPCSTLRAAFVAASCLLAHALAAQGCASLGSAAAYAVGTTPYSVALADFDGDGKLDLATANAASNNVSIRPGQPNGAFGTASAFAAGTAPSFVATGDFNRDGKLDLAVTNAGSSNVSILIGNGAGAFAAPDNYSVGSQPYTVAVADLNRDGKADLAVASYAGGNTAILIGNGDGTFTAGTPLTAAGAVFVAAGDFNRDGKPDLAVARFGTALVAVFLGVGDGTFTNGNSLTTGNDPRAITTGDFNRDGKVDLAVANQGTANVSVFIGNGNGTFANAVSYSVPTLPRSIVAADVTADGLPDLAVASSVASNNVSLLVGSGGGAFAAAVQFSAGNVPRGIAAGPLDAYPPVDLVVANESSNDVTVLLNQSSCTTDCGTLSAAINFSSGNRPRKLATADFNRDGNLDLAVPNENDNKVGILLGTSGGTFGVPSLLNTVANPVVAATGDFNRDGNQDLAVGHAVATSISIFLGLGNGAFSAGTSLTLGTTTNEIVIADFNRDGRLDLAAVQGIFYSVGVFLGNGDGTFGTVTSVTASLGYPQSIAAADFNRDGKMDLATANGGNNTVSILIGNGDGTFAPWAGYFVTGYAYKVAAGDVNRDGRPDLIVGRAPATLSVLLGTGTGTLNSPVNSTVTNDPFELAVIDDGVSWLQVLANQAGAASVTRVLLDPATALVSSPEAYPIATSAAGVVVGDFNRDGRLDGAVTNLDGQNVSVLLNYCETSTSLTQSAGTSYHGLGATLTAEVAGASALIGPTGTVTFRYGSTVIGTGTLNQSYQATATTAFLPLGTHSITATYNGNSIFAPSTSDALSHTVLMGPPTETYAIPNAPGTQVDVNWNSAPGAASYEVWKSFNNGAFTLLGSTSGLSLPDAAVTTNVAYVYKVRSIAGQTQSPFGRPAVATTVSFTDDPLVAQATIIKTVHLTELRAAVNLVRASAGLGPFPFTDVPPVIVRLDHLDDLYTALGEAWQILGMYPLIPSLPQDPVVRALPFNGVRAIVRSGPFGGPPN